MVYTVVIGLKSVLKTERLVEACQRLIQEVHKAIEEDKGISLQFLESCFVESSTGYMDISSASEFAHSIGMLKLIDGKARLSGDPLPEVDPVTAEYIFRRSALGDLKQFLENYPDLVRKTGS